MTKFCPRCRLDLDESQFGNNERSRDGLEYQCRACKADYERDRRTAKDSLVNTAFKARVGVHSRRNHVHQSKVAVYGETMVQTLESHKEDWQEQTYAAGFAVPEE
jgi:DNA-directed RNA polymerase subunit M/transcription elongation factor TFIIS